MDGHRRVYRIGEFLLDVAAYELRWRDRSVRLERRPMELLIWLVERRGELITRDEIVDRLWGRDVFIDVDTGVNTVVRKIRRALRDSGDDSQFIQTVPGKGYKFIAAVEQPVAGAVLCVLPFRNLHASSEDDYIADGLTEETIASLGRLDPERLRVIGRTSSMIYRATTKSIAEIGRELGADYLLEGSIRGSDGQHRVTATLIRVRDQVQVWTDTYDRESKNLLGLQAELGRDIARQIQLRLSPERTTTIARRQTQNPDAYDAYLRGRYYWNQMTPATVSRALECYERATTLDPDYALVWAGIADAISSRPFNSDARPRDVAEQARRAAYRALRTSDVVPEACTSAAFVQFVFDWDWPAAEGNCRRAVALDPSYGQGYWMLAHTLSQQGRHQNALALTPRSRELDPFNAMTHAMSAQLAFQARDFDGGVSHAREALRVEPDFWIAHLQLGQSLLQLGRSAQALDALEEATRLSRGNTKPISTSGYTLATLGRHSEALEILAALERRSGERYVSPYAFALIHAGLGDRASAYHRLDQAFAERDVHLIYLPVDPKWDAFRGDPQFAQLLDRLASAAATDTITGTRT